MNEIQHITFISKFNFEDILNKNYEEIKILECLYIWLIKSWNASSYASNDSLLHLYLLISINYNTITSKNACFASNIQYKF